MLLLENPEVRGFADYNTLKDLCKIKEDLINPFSKGKIEKPDFGDDINWGPQVQSLSTCRPLENLLKTFLKTFV